FVDARRLHVGDRRFGRGRRIGALGQGLRGGRGRRRRRHRAGNGFAPRLALQLLRFVAPAAERLGEFGFAAVGGQRRGRCGRGAEREEEKGGEARRGMASWHEVLPVWTAG